MDPTEKCDIEECSEVTDLYWCLKCKEKYCESCWNDEHRRGKHAQDKTYYRDYKIIYEILSTENDTTKRAEMHSRDRLARWIGVKDTGLWDWSRMPYLIHQASHEFGAANQYPSVAAFIGNTGSGKSTLVKALIRLAHHTMGSKGAVGDTPIPASAGETHLSTSGDIHLYIDPLTAVESNPLLYADSEGLQGVVTVASKASSHIPQIDPSQPASNDPDDVEVEEIGGDIRRNQFPQYWSESRKILWAEGDKADRNYIVDHLYPRFLYTFSDVVVFVTRDLKTRKSDTIQLLNWASLGYETTLNQRTPPALLLVINNDDRRELDPRWHAHDTNFATEKWLSLLDEEVTADAQGQGTFARFEELKARWLKRGIQVSRPSELLRRYYSVVRVVCISSAHVSSPTIIKQQYEATYRYIRRLSDRVSTKKRDAGLRLDTASFHIYVREALDHLAKEHDRPFDLQEASGKVRPIPRRFAEHVLHVLLLLRSKFHNETEIGTLMKVAQLVAACVAFSAFLEKEENPEVHFKEVFAEPVSEVYDVFFRQHWRCEEMQKTQRCLNVFSAHSKGHQYNPGGSDRFGIYITNGDFKANYNPPMFMALVSIQLKRLQKPYNASLHSQALSSMWWLHRVSTNRTCFSCLSNNPEHLLGCSHVLCNECASAFSIASVGASISHMLTINCCPFGCTSGSWPWTVFVKPPTAGVRVLTLDGGGCRGVLELMVLVKLEGLIHAAGLPKIKISEMFDLIVGTSTGGIIALGIGHCHWGTVEALEKFETVAKRVFTPRRVMRIPGLNMICKYVYSYVYMTTEAEKVFKETFSEDLKLFGSNIVPAKVAVTTLCAGSGTPRGYLLGNYSRPFAQEDDDRECLVRPENPEHELKIWEAARATSAAPTFFESFAHSPTGRVYIDGALRFNNPMDIANWERKKIWPTSGNSPDIHVSIGTGKPGSRSSPAAHSDVIRPNPLRREWTGLGVLVQIAKDAVKDTMDSEEKWNSFCQQLDPADIDRYHRFNVVLYDGVPGMQDFNAIEALKKSATEYCSQPDVERQLKTVARKLVASTFYFEFERWTRPGHKWECSGYLCNRLWPTHPDSVNYLVSMNPVFHVYEVGGSKSVVRVTAGPQTDSHGWWRMKLAFSTYDHNRKMDIKVLLPRTDEQFSISGFPRVILL